MSVIQMLFSNQKYNFLDIFASREITSKAMRAAIQDWVDMYYTQLPTDRADPCQRLPYTIVRKITKTVFSEYEVRSSDPFVGSLLDSLNRKKEDGLQAALISGEALLKPSPGGSEWRWTVIRRESVLVFGRDAEGVPTDVGTVEQFSDSRYYYTLAERRTVDGNGYLTVRNKLYRSTNDNTPGAPVDLTSVPRTAELPDVYTFPEPVWSTGLVRIKTPMANCVDGSCDGVSVYAAAVGLIHNIDRNEAQINGEFERGESRIIVSNDMLKRGKDGRRGLVDNIFVGLDDDQESTGITVFSPAFRDASFLARKQEYLRNVESVIGLKRGLLSEVEAVERTATEITSSQGEYNLTIIDFQNMWEAAVREAVRVCGILGQMYHIPGAHEAGADSYTIDWGNGVLFDEEKTWADYKDMVARGLIKPEIAVGWRFNMPAETESDLAKIRRRYMPEPDIDGGEE